MGLKAETSWAWARGPLSVLVVAAAYYATGRLALLLAIPPGFASPLWPPAGLALAAILLCGYRVWPGIVLGSFCINAFGIFEPALAGSVARALAIATTIGLGAAAQAMLGAFLIERTIAEPAAFVREEDVIKFLTFGGPVSCLLSASVAMSFLLLGGLIPANGVWFTWCTWWVGDTIGAILFAPLVLVWLAPAPEMTRRRQLSVSVPLAAMFVLAMVAFLYARSWETYRLEREFDRRSDGLVYAVRKSVDADVDVLYATRGLFMASADVDQHEFREFTLRYLARHPGVRALAWDARVRRSERAAFEAELRREPGVSGEIRELAADGSFVRAGDRDEFVVIRYVEPFGGNGSPVSLDVSSDSFRGPALRRARDLAVPSATEAMPLLQDRRPRAGFVVYLPVYAGALTPVSVEERRQHLRGFVVGVFQIQQMMSAALHGLARDGLELAAYDGAVAEPGRLVYQTVAVEEIAEARGVPQVKQVSIEVGGHEWLLELAATPAFAIANHSLQAWTVLAGSVLFTALAGAFLLVLTGRTAFVEGIVAERTAALGREATDRARAVEALRRSEELFRTLSTAAPLGIFQTDLEGRCLYTNPRWREISGLTLEESLGGGYLRAVHPDDRSRIQAVSRSPSHAAEEPPIEFRLVSPSGKLSWVRARTSAVRSPQGLAVGFVATAEDVTENKRALEALRESEERHRMLAEQSSDFISRMRIDGTVIYASPACRSLLGYEPRELVGKSMFDVLYPADVEPVRAEIDAAARTGGVVTVSYRVQTKTRGSVWLETTLRVFSDATAGEIVAVSRDVSERKRVERMRQDLVAMVSHDLKNPLTAVLGFTEILRDLPADDGQRDEFLVRIAANAHSALSLAMNFVDASQIDGGTIEPRLEPVFLNEVVEHVLRHQESRAHLKQIELEARLDRAAPMALLDRRLIDRVIGNLVNNAVKFAPVKTRVTVETATANGNVHVRVRDQGPGIPPKQRAKMYQRFSEMGTRRGDSTGLGLFIVKTLVDAQGGTVNADFPDEGGTVFEVSFPVGG